MIQIGKTIVSFDLLDKLFTCDLAFCKGACCIHGDSGAPLEQGEAELIEKAFPYAMPYMQAQGIKAVEQLGYSVVDSDGDLVTPLINGCECAFVYFNNGIAFCALEKAYLEGKSTFRKPISCYLYPVRITKYESFDAVNYHKWEICSCAVTKGEELGTPVYVFLKEPLIAKYGSEWYKELEIAAAHYNKK